MVRKLRRLAGAVGFGLEIGCGSTMNYFPDSKNIALFGMVIGGLLILWSFSQFIYEIFRYLKKKWSKGDRKTGKVSVFENWSGSKTQGFKKFLDDKMVQARVADKTNPTLLIRWSEQCARAVKIALVNRLQLDYMPKFNNIDLVFVVDSKDLQIRNFDYFVEEYCKLLTAIKNSTTHSDLLDGFDVRDLKELEDYPCQSASTYR